MNDQLVNDLAQVAVEDTLEVVDRQVEAVVGHPGLGVIVGPDLFAPLPCPHLGAPVFGDLGVLFALGDVQEAGAEDAQRLLLVAVLRLLVLTGDHETGGSMGDADGGVVAVDVLAAWSRGSKGVNLQVFRVDIDIYLICLGEYGHSHRRGVDAAGGLGPGNPLHPMDAALVLEGGEDVLAPDADDDFLEAADGGYAGLEDLELPAAGVGKTGDHEEGERA